MRGGGGRDCGLVSLGGGGYLRDGGLRDRGELNSCLLEWFFDVLLLVPVVKSFLFRFFSFSFFSFFFLFFLLRD